jgi:hypothetical protein
MISTGETAPMPQGQFNIDVNSPYRARTGANTDVRAFDGLKTLHGKLDPP